MNAIICGLLYIQADSGYLYRIYRRWNCWLKPEVHYNTMCIVTAPILVQRECSNYGTTSHCFICLGIL